MANMNSSPSSLDASTLIELQNQISAHTVPEVVEATMTVAPAEGILYVNSKADVLANCNGTDLSGRHVLWVTNLSDSVLIRYGTVPFQLVSAINYEQGQPIEPGQTVKITFSPSSVPVKLRSMGSQVQVLIREA